MPVIGTSIASTKSTSLSAYIQKQGSQRQRKNSSQRRKELKRKIDWPMMIPVRPGWAMKAIINVILFWSILFRCVSATDHTVGGEIGWDISSDVKSWASSTVFFTGDNLEFVYTPEHDVIEVEEQGYVRCQIRSPIRTYNNDGDTVIPLMNPGTRYFVCGSPGHCSLGMKIQVDVLPRPQRVASFPSTEAGNSNTTAASPAGSGNRVEGPGHDLNPNQRRSAPPPGNPPLPQLSDDQPPQSQENRNTTERPSPNRASQRGVVSASWLGLCRFTATTGCFFYSSFIAICYFALL